MKKTIVVLAMLAAPSMLQAQTIPQECGRKAAAASLSGVDSTQIRLQLINCLNGGSASQPKSAMKSSIQPNTATVMSRLDLIEAKLDSLLAFITGPNAINLAHVTNASPAAPPPGNNINAPATASHAAAIPFDQSLTIGVNGASLQADTVYAEQLWTCATPSNPAACNWVGTVPLVELKWNEYPNAPFYTVHLAHCGFYTTQPSVPGMNTSYDANAGKNLTYSVRFTPRPPGPSGDAKFICPFSVSVGNSSTIRTQEAVLVLTSRDVLH